MAHKKLGYYGYVEKNTRKAKRQSLTGKSGWQRAEKRKYKTIDGKRYTMRYRQETKSEAKDLAKYERKSGNNARVVKDYNRGPKSYSVYTRKGGR